MAVRMELTFNKVNTIWGLWEWVKKIDIEFSKRVFELVDINNYLQSLSEITRLKKLAKTDELSLCIFLEISHIKDFDSQFTTLLGLTQLHQLVEKHRPEVSICVTRAMKEHLNFECGVGLIVSRTREQLMFRFTLTNPPGIKIFK